MTPTVTITELQKKPSLFSTEKRIFKIENKRKKKLLSFVIPIHQELSTLQEEQFTKQIKNIQFEFSQKTNKKIIKKASKSIMSLGAVFASKIPKNSNIDADIEKAKEIFYTQKYV